MSIIIGIIIILVVLGIIGILLDWVRDHKGIIIAIVAGAILLYIGGIKLLLGAVAVLLIIGYIVSLIQKSNDKKLETILNTSCTQLGCVNSEAWRSRLPMYADKMYSTSFDEITQNFTQASEKQHITDDQKLTWLDPASKYLAKSVMADVYELAQVPSEGLMYTHSTPNGQLIKDAMDNLCIAKIVDNRHMIHKVQLEADAIRKAHGFREGHDVPEYLLWAYRIDDYVANKSIHKEESNIESEEISLDDL